MIRTFGWLVGFLTLLGTGGYVITYLVRWEWNRSLLAATLFVATEVALASALILRAVAKNARACQPGGGGATGRTDVATDSRVLAHVRAAPAPPVQLPWLSVRDDRVGVFIPVLLGAGLALSVMAWLVQWIAAASSNESQEQALAEDLTVIAFPHGGLVPPDDALVAAGHPRPSADLVRLVRPGTRA